MRRLRRFAAATAALHFQLVLAGSGHMCMPSIQQAGSGNTTATTMPGMDMPIPEQSLPPGGDEVPCHLPASAGCQLAPCSPALEVSTRVSYAAIEFVATPVDRTEPLAPPSRTTRPELPPPRV